MRQFDVHRSTSNGPLLLILQAEVVHDLNVVVAAPLYPMADWQRPARHLHPIFEIDGKSHVLVTNHLAAVPRQQIASRVTSLADCRTDIIAALDFLFTGV